MHKVPQNIGSLIESGLKTPEDFLEFNAERAGYRGMRGTVRKMETDLNYTSFAEKVMQEGFAKDNHDAYQ